MQKTKKIPNVVRMANMLLLKGVRQWKKKN